MLTSKRLRQLFLDFFAAKGHAILPSASLVPKEDPTVLFNTAGMQPLINYLLGEKHVLGNRLANCQKCLRTDDIEEVGDNRHITFFEMLGHWSLGDYFKKEAIEWNFEFLTDPKWLGQEPRRIYVTVYRGLQTETNSQEIGEDTEAIEYWQNQFAKVGIQAQAAAEIDFKELIAQLQAKTQTADLETYKLKDLQQLLASKNLPQLENFVPRIRKMSGKDNWWGLPYRGPCGPCSEIYFLLPTQPLDFELSIFPELTLPQIANWIEENIVEIGNSVFMEFVGEKNADKEPKNIERLSRKNIDVGLGFERYLMVINGLDNVYETDVLKPLVQVVEKYQGI